MPVDLAQRDCEKLTASSAPAAATVLLEVLQQKEEQKKIMELALATSEHSYPCVIIGGTSKEECSWR